ELLMRRSLIAVALLVGCYDPHPQDGTLVCDAQRRCPQGYECIEDNTCWRKSGARPDLSANPGNDLAVEHGRARDGDPDLLLPCTCDPPPDSCDGNVVVHSTPRCEASGCVFDAARTPCNTPPPPTCTGGVETTYASSGTCMVNGGVASCTYAPTVAT